MHIGIVIPVFNKSREIEICLDNLFKHSILFDYDLSVVVVDDGSVDNSLEIIKKLESKHNFYLINNLSNYGKGYSLRIGFEKLLLNDKNYDCVGYIDADLDIALDSLISLFNSIILNDNDAAIGSKYVPSSKLNYPKHRLFFSKIYNLLNRILFGIKINDTQTGMKFFKPSSLLKILPNLDIVGFGIDLQILIHFHVHNFKISEHPVEINFNNSSSLNIYSGLRTFLDSFKLWRSFQNKSNSDFR